MGGWQSETDLGPQRSSEAHSPSPGYATDDAFGGTDGGPGWPDRDVGPGSTVLSDLVFGLVHAPICAVLGCSAANAAPNDDGRRGRCSKPRGP